MKGNVIRMEQQQQAQEKTFTIVIPESHVHVIGRSLEVLPYKEAAPVIANMQQQINIQLQQEQQAAAEAEAAAQQAAATEQAAE
jgi:hypothetical protein